MTLQELLGTQAKQLKQPSAAELEAQLEAKRATTAKLLAANKARAAEILAQALRKLDASSSSTSSVKRRFVI